MPSLAGSTLALHGRAHPQGSQAPHPARSGAALL